MKWSWQRGADKRCRAAPRPPNRCSRRPAPGGPHRGAPPSRPQVLGFTPDVWRASGAEAAHRPPRSGGTKRCCRGKAARGWWGDDREKLRSWLFYTPSVKKNFFGPLPSPLHAGSSPNAEIFAPVFWGSWRSSLKVISGKPLTWPQDSRLGKDGIRSLAHTVHSKYTLQIDLNVNGTVQY